MSRFKRIKNKSNKKSSVSIDEKIAALNKQLKKTGMLSEEPTMTTSNIYPEVSETPNQDLIDFEAIMTGGQRLGFSGADGNTAGNASIGDAAGFTDVALSPPHPVTGLRISAFHVRDGTGGTTPLRPGKTTTRGFGDNPPVYTMGSVLWFYDSDFDNGAGQPAGKWCNLEYSNFDDTAGQWFFWDTIKSGQFAGIYIVNTDLSQHPCGDISGLISGLNFPGEGGAIGPPFNTVDNSKGTGDADQYPPLPFGDSISDEAFDALEELAMGANYDMYNWILKTYGMPAAEWYLKTGKTQGNPFVPYGSYFPRASNPLTGAQDGEMLAFFGGNKNNNKTPEKPTKKTRKGATDATAASTGMYPEMTPAIFQQKYGMTWQEYMNLP